MLSAHTGRANPSTIQHLTNLIILLRNLQVCACVNRGNALTKNTFMSCPDFVLFFFIFEFFFFHLILSQPIISPFSRLVLTIIIGHEYYYYSSVEYYSKYIAFESDCEQTTTCKRNTFHSGTKDRQGTLVCVPP